MKVWVEALRLRTLPLSVAGTLVAGGLAAFFGVFRLSTFILMLVTVLLLQITSNFADEYGDLQKGVDNQGRVGPIRGMQRGEITYAQMKRALIGCALAAFLCGVILILASLKTDWRFVGIFLLMGLATIAGAITYTVGKKAYGYHALGDLSSFLFFGVFAVSGGFFLYAHSYVWTVALPTVSVGCLVTGVLNLNNMRDLENDALCGKTTVAVLLGPRGSLAYHHVLIIVGLTGFLAFMIASSVANPLRYLFVFLYVPLILQLIEVGKVTDPAHFDRFMKPLSLGTALLSAAFALCLAL